LIEAKGANATGIGYYYKITTSVINGGDVFTHLFSL
jgi:hypothetical protein